MLNVFPGKLYLTTVLKDGWGHVEGESDWHLFDFDNEQELIDWLQDGNTGSI